MKIRIQKSQWERIGQEAGWLKTSSKQVSKIFESKKEALKFLDDNALMAVRWKDKNGIMEACYFNGKLYVTKSARD